MHLSEEAIMRNDYDSNYLAHYGIQGMKWGVRRYQNPDGTLTDAGKSRYGTGKEKVEKVISLAGKAVSSMASKDRLDSLTKGGPVKGNIEREKKLMDKVGISTTFESNQKLNKKVEEKSRHSAVGEAKEKAIKKLKQVTNNTPGKGLTKSERQSVLQAFMDGFTEEMNRISIEQAEQARMQNEQLFQQQLQMQQQQMFMQQAITDANRTASLSITGGMNPFLFG